MDLKILATARDACYLAWHWHKGSSNPSTKDWRDDWIISRKGTAIKRPWWVGAWKYGQSRI